MELELPEPEQAAVFEPPRYRVSEADPEVELLTPRLILRRFLPSDGPLLTELDIDPEVTRFITGGEPPKPDLDKLTAARLAREFGNPAGLGFLMAHERVSGGFVGWFHFRADLRPGQDPSDVDLGYRLLRRCWGCGLATEGSQALLQRGFEELGLQRVVAYALLANRASWRVMEKLGMQRVAEFAETRFPGPDNRAVKYALTAQAYRRGQCAE